MNVMPIMDILIVNDSSGHPREPVAPPHQIEEAVLELLGVAFDNSVRVLTENLHLTLVALAHTVALEAVFVTALFLAHLTVPSELLETFGFDSIGDCFWGEEFVLAHLRLEITEDQRQEFRTFIEMKWIYYKYAAAI